MKNLNKIKFSSLFFNYLAKSHSSSGYLSSNAIFNFKHQLALHEHEVTCLNPDPSTLKKMDKETLLKNRIAAQFLEKAELYK